MFLFFIDASVYRSQRFSLTKKPFLSLAKGISDGKAKLISTPVTEAEIQRRIIDLLSEAAEASKKFELLIGFEPEFLAVRQYDFGDTALRKIFENYKNKLSPFIIENTAEDLTLVLEMYAEQIKPFNPENKKKAEIKDALIFKALERFSEGQGGIIHICSRDGDFANYFAENKNIKLFDDINKLVDEYLRISAISSHDGVVNAVRKYEREILDRIREELQETYHYKTDDFNTEIIEVVAKDIEIISIQVSAIESDSATASLDFSADVQIELSTEAIVRDPVDRDEVSLGHNKNIIDENVWGTCQVTLTLSEENEEYADFYVEEIRVLANEIEIPEEFGNPFQHHDDDEE